MKEEGKGGGLDEGGRKGERIRREEMGGGEVGDGEGGKRRSVEC